jgi:predicted phage terminase large subunit-like protein
LPADQWKGHCRNLARTDLYFLIRYGLGRGDVERQWLFDRCQEVQASPNGHLDLWAREHYKSTIITFGKTIQDILASHGDDPLPEWDGREVTVGLFSHTRPIAKGFLRQIKNELEGNALLKEWFTDVLWENPKAESPKWSEDEGIVVKRKTNPKEATVEAWGVVDGQPTSKHYLLLVYDDVVTQESVTTPEQLEKTMRSLELSFNLGADGGIRRFIGTRYHFNDAYRTITNRGSAEPRIYAATDDGTPNGNPVFLSAEQLAQKRRDQGPYTFACQMLQNPVADEAQGFKDSWLRYYDGVLDWSDMNRMILIDPASAKKKNSDYTAGFVIGLASDLNIYVLDMKRDRLNLTQRADLVMNWHRKYKPMRVNGVRYEKVGLQADIEHIEDRQARENYRFDITEVGGTTAKTDRIKRLLPYFEQGRIYFPRSLHVTDYQGVVRDLVHDFVEEEYKAFPVPIHDDLLDDLARLAEPDLELVWPEEKTPEPDSDYMPHYGGHGTLG